MRTSKATEATDKQGRKPLLQLLEATPNKGQGSIMAAAVLQKLGGENRDVREKIWSNTNPKDIAKLRERDKSLGNKRAEKNQPFFLSVSGQRVLYALARIIDEERKKKNATDIKEKITNPSSKDAVIRRVRLADLAKITHGDTRRKYREEVFKALQGIAQTYQIFTTKGENGEVYYTIFPLIGFFGGKVMEKDGTTFLEEVNIIFNKIFFEGLGKHYAYIPDKVFVLLRKNRTALYATLLDTFLGEYWGHIGAAKNVRRAIWRKAKNKATEGETITEEELIRMQDEAAKKEMKVEFLADTIKEKIGGKDVTDYESTREQRRRFWQDLARAVADLKELGLVEEAERVEGTDKVIFYLSENYKRNADRIGDLTE